jgi:hypothetical protein
MTSTHFGLTAFEMDKRVVRLLRLRPLNTRCDVNAARTYVGSQQAKSPHGVNASSYPSGHSLNCCDRGWAELRKYDPWIAFLLIPRSDYRAWGTAGKSHRGRVAKSICSRARICY